MQETEPRQASNFRVVIVGNGPSLLNHKNGAFIDDSDWVIRMNVFNTSGFEEYSGSKTNIYMGDVGYLKGKMSKLLSHVHEFWLPYMPNKTANEFFRSGSLAGCRALFYNEDSYRLKDSVEHPTTGLKTIVMAIRELAYFTIYVTGFGMTKGGWYWEKDHEHWCGHDKQKEEDFIKDLVSSGKIIHMDILNSSVDEL